MAALTNLQQKLKDGLHLKKPHVSTKRFHRQIEQIQKGLKAETKKRTALKNLDLFVLGNSIRETTVGQLRGHTLENKWGIYKQVKLCGFKHMIVAAFSHMTRLGDTFIKELAEQGEDFSCLYAFSELYGKVHQKVPDFDDLPIGLVKMKELGMKNAIIEIDLVYDGLDYEKFTVNDICRLLRNRFKWCRENLTTEAKIFVNFRDFSEAMMQKPKRLLNVVHFVSSLPHEERPFGLIYEELGKYLPEEVAVWTRAIRDEMDHCGWKDGHLLVHVHEQWGLKDITQLECLANGANGIWAGVCEEGAGIGHASSTITLMNMVRMGNEHVVKRYNCSELRKAAQVVTQITTGLDAHPKQVVYGARALDMVFGVEQVPRDKNEFNMCQFFGEEPILRITTLASPGMIVAKLKKFFGDDPQFTEDIAYKMKEQMLDDLRENRKEEYMSAVGLALLFDRAGGSLTEAISDVIEKSEPNAVHVGNLINEIHDMWNEWDIRDGTQDDCVEFDNFYNGFMAPYFSCYRCDETKRALQAIDMDKDGTVDWKEFALYLKWAGNEYPQIKTAEEVLSTAFRKGLIPAMQDEVIKQVEIEKKEQEDLEEVMNNKQETDEVFLQVNTDSDYESD